MTSVVAASLLATVVHAAPVYNTSVPLSRPTGWVKSPDGRGTADILSTYIIILALCIWTTVHPNISSKPLRAKFLYSFIALFAPDIMVVLAWTERKKATKVLVAWRRSVALVQAQKAAEKATRVLAQGISGTGNTKVEAARNKLKDARHKARAATDDIDEALEAIKNVRVAVDDYHVARAASTVRWWLSGICFLLYQISYNIHRVWRYRIRSNKHEMGMEVAFFAVMGGFRFCPVDGYKKEKYERTLSADWLISLLELGAIDGMRLAELKPDIVDKGKADKLAKLLVCGQALWMIVNYFARGAISLPIIPTEVNSFIHVMCAMAAYAVWWSKPYDPCRTILLDRSILTESTCSVLFTATHPFGITLYASETLPSQLVLDPALSGETQSPSDVECPTNLTSGEAEGSPTHDLPDPIWNDVHSNTPESSEVTEARFRGPDILSDILAVSTGSIAPSSAIQGSTRDGAASSVNEDINTTGVDCDLISVVNEVNLSLDSSTDAAEASHETFAVYTMHHVGQQESITASHDNLGSGMDRGGQEVQILKVSEYLRVAYTDSQKEQWSEGIPPTLPKGSFYIDSRRGFTLKMSRDTTLTSSELDIFEHAANALRSSAFPTLVSRGETDGPYPLTPLKCDITSSKGFFKLWELTCTSLPIFVITAVFRFQYNPMIENGFPSSLEHELWIFSATFASVPIYGAAAICAIYDLTLNRTKKWSLLPIKNPSLPTGPSILNTLAVLLLSVAMGLLVIPYVVIINKISNAQLGYGTTTFLRFLLVVPLFAFSRFLSWLMMFLDHENLAMVWERFRPITEPLLTMLYCMARVYILVETFLCLRDLPPDAYKSVSWEDLIPHL